MCISRRSHHRRLVEIVASAPTRLAFRDASDELGISFVTDEGPAFFVAHVVLRIDGAVLDQCLGVFQITIDGLDGCPDAIFLSWHSSVSCLPPRD